jgi:hypothetical protein
MSNTHPYSGAAPIPKVSDFLREQREQFADVDQETPELTLQAEQQQQQQQEAGESSGNSGDGGGGDGGGGRRRKTKRANAHPSQKEQTKAIKNRKERSGNRRTVKDPTTEKDVVIEDVDADFKNAVDDPNMVVPKIALPGHWVSVGCTELCFVESWGEC